jgi:hypothetical protein
MQSLIASTVRICEAKFDYKSNLAWILEAELLEELFVQVMETRNTKFALLYHRS